MIKKKEEVRRRRPSISWCRVRHGTYRAGELSTLDRKPQALNPQTQALNLEPYTLNLITKKCSSVNLDTRRDTHLPNTCSIILTSRCRANIAHVRQSRPYSGPGSQAKVLKTFQGAPSSLGSGALEPWAPFLRRARSFLELNRGEHFEQYDFWDLRSDVFLKSLVDCSGT